MPRSLNIHLLPALTSPDELAGGIVVAIDVLRASTTIATALAAGAECVIPCLEIDEARRRAGQLPPDAVRLGGERGGVKIEGFDFGNSPAEYTPQTVGGKTVIFTTTNGTKALLMAGRAATALMAGFVNAAATIRAVESLENLDIHLLCAGTQGYVSREDVLFAGCLVDRLDAAEMERNDSTEIALAAWQRCDQSNLAAELCVSRGGRNCVRLGLDADIKVAAAIDSLDVVAQFDPAAGRLERM